MIECAITYRRSQCVSNELLQPTRSNWFLVSPRYRCVALVLRRAAEHGR